MSLLGLTGWLVAASCGGRAELRFSVAAGGADSVAPELAAGSAGVGADAAGLAGRDGSVPGDLGNAGNADDAQAGSAGAAQLDANDVIGTLVSTELAPVVGATIELAGTTVMTDSTGSFRVHDVPASYDAFVVYLPLRAVDSYQGLTTRTPHFSLSVPPEDTHRVAVYGRLSGGVGFPTPAGHRAVVQASNAHDFGSWAVNPDGQSYAFPALSWQAPNASTFTLGALQWTAQNRLPTGYDGWGTKVVTLSPGVDLGAYGKSTPATDLVLSPIAAHVVSGTISSPDDCELHLWAGVDEIEIVSQAPAEGGQFSYLLPSELPGAVLRLIGSCADTTSIRSISAIVGLGAASSDISFELPKAPVLVAPNDSATGVTTSTPLSWDTNGTPLSDVLFLANGLTIHRYLRGGSSTFPDLSRFGIFVAPGQFVTWQVSTSDLGARGSGTTDDALHASAADLRTGDRLVIGRSDTRGFTLSP